MVLMPCLDRSVLVLTAVYSQILNGNDADGVERLFTVSALRWVYFYIFMTGTQTKTKHRRSV